LKWLVTLTTVLRYRAACDSHETVLQNHCCDANIAMAAVSMTCTSKVSSVNICTQKSGAKTKKYYVKHDYTIYISKMHLNSRISSEK